jgi:hypothetical protein
MLDLQSLRKVERDCFVAVLKHLVATDQHYLPYRDLEEGSFPDVPRPFVPMALQLLVDRKYLMSSLDRDGNITSWALHPEIAPDAYEFMQAGYKLPGPTWEEEVPAADRFVPLDHNSQAYKEADEALEQLAEELDGKNDLFANAEERLAVVSEVKSIQTALAGHSIRAVTVAAITRGSGTLSWLTTEAFSGSIRALATKAIEYFWKYVWPGTG